jgi:alpha-tubulin suppressor-like RCC1 family protein
VGGSVVQAGGNSYTLSNVTANKTIQVTFKVVAVTTYTVTPSAGANGSISPSSVQTVNSGGSASFTATPFSGYVVDQWLVNGGLIQAGGNSYTLSNLTANKTVLVNFKLAPDTIQPSVAITSPTSSSTHSTSNGSLNLAGSASDNVGVTQVTWGNDRGGSGTASGLNNWSVTGIALSSGQNIITVTARDAVGNTQTDTLTVTYNAADTTKPEVTITAPVNTSTYATTTSSLSLGGTASDAGGITQVTWSNDRGGSGTAAGTTSWLVSGIALSAGQNILTISGWDANSNIGTDTLSVTYTPPGEHPWKGPVTPLMVDLPDGRYFGISFNRLTGALGSGIRIEGSENLRDWVDATPSMLMHDSPVPNEDGIREIVTFRCPLPISDSRASGLRFLRLNMTPSVIKLSSSGYNGSGQLGDGTTISRETVVFVDQTAIGQRAISAISCGAYFSLALTTDGKIFSWGDNTFGQLGDGTTTQRTIPVFCGAIGGKTVAAIAAGGNHCLALTTDGLVYSWGYNGYGQLGDGTTAQRTTPVAVNTSGALSGKTVVSIAAGSGYSLALTSDGKVFSWGDGSNGTIGNSSFASKTLPVAVDVSGVLSGKVISAISAGAYHCLALSSDGKVFSWGGAGVGQLGSGDSTNQSRPVAVNLTDIEVGSVVNAIAAGGYSSIALTSAGNLLSWGYNINGQIGDGTQTTRFLPVPIILGGALQGRGISTISAGLNHCMATTPDGKVVAWGNNVHGEYGNGTTISSLVPAVVGIQATAFGTGSTSQHTLFIAPR